jgi:hypothetical protein
MEKTNLSRFTADLSYDVVAQIAPQELPLFRANREAFLRSRDRFQLGQTGQDEMLGFGAGGTIELMTPAILVMTAEVIRYLTEEIKKSAKEESASFIGETVKQLFKKFRTEQTKTEPPKNAPAPLDAAQLARVRQAALKKARLLKLSDARAKLLADAIVGMLAVEQASS